MVIAVLMTVFNRKQTTLNCLSHLFENKVSGCSFKVFLVDDGCTDGTGEAVAQYFPEVNVIKGEGDLFWNRGMYKAWSVAQNEKADYYFWLNDDTLLNKDAISSLLSIAKDNDNECIVSGSLCSPTDNNRATYGGLIKDKVVKPNGEVLSCDTTNGNALLIPQKVFLRIGLNNPFYRHSRGDLDYGFRVRKAGYKVLATGSFVGTCERHDRTFKCYDKSVSFINRIKYLYSPLGFNPIEVFKVSKLGGGVFHGLKIVFITHFKTYFPTLWDLIYNYHKKRANLR